MPGPTQVPEFWQTTGQSNPRHSGPKNPPVIEQSQTSGIAQNPPFPHVNEPHAVSSQRAPVNPVPIQSQVSGPTHNPPFRQGNVHENWQRFETWLEVKQHIPTESMELC